MHPFQKKLHKKVAQISINNQCRERSVSPLNEHLPLKDASSSTFYSLQHTIKHLIGRIVQCLALLKKLSLVKKYTFTRIFPYLEQFAKEIIEDPLKMAKYPFQ
jgi:hypothetical protein